MAFGSSLRNSSYVAFKAGLALYFETLVPNCTAVPTEWA